MIGSKEIDMISKADIYDTYKDLYLNKEEREEKLLQAIHSATGLKAWVGAKKGDGKAITLITKENAIKKTLGKRFAIPLFFNFFRHPVYHYGLKEELIVRFEVNFSENVILCSRNTTATYKLSLEYDAIFDERYAATIVELYTGTKSIP